MAEKKTKFWNLQADSLHAFRLRAWSVSGTSLWTDSFPIRTSGILPIQWPSNAVIDAAANYFFRSIQVTWTPLLDFSLRFSHYVLFRKDTTESEGYEDPTPYELWKSGQDIVNGNLVNNIYFLKETGKFPGYTDLLKVSEDSIDSGFVQEHEYHYWVWAVDVNGQTSYMPDIGDGQGYLTPDNAEWGVPSIPEILPDEMETEVVKRNTWFCSVKLVWKCTDGAEGYWIQWKESASWFWSLPYWVEHNSENIDEEYPDRQWVTLPNFLCATKYDFKMQAVNVQIFLVSLWSSIASYLTEEDPYPPDEILNLSAFRLKQDLFTKGEYVKLTWDWPTGAIMKQQIDHYRVYREIGTIYDAEAYVHTINFIEANISKASPYSETQKFGGTMFIDDDVVKQDDVEAYTLASFFWNGEFGSASEDDQKTAYINISHNTEVGNLVAGATILDDEFAYDGTHSLRTNAQNKVLQFLAVDDAIDGDEGYISFRFRPIDIDFTATYIQILHFFFDGGADSFWVDMRSGYLYVKHEGQNAEKEVIHTRKFTAADYYTWFHIEIRWKVSTDSLQIRIDEGSWKSSVTPTPLESFSEDPASFNIGPGTTVPGAVDCNMRIDRVMISPSYGVPDFKQYYHYWVTAVDEGGLESVATMPFVTISKATDEGVDGQMGTGESFDFVSFDPPAATTLLHPLSNEDEGFNLCQVLFWQLYTVKLVWQEVGEATHYRVKIRIKPPAALGVELEWGPWIYSAHIEEAHANEGEGDPFFVYPLYLQKHTWIEWAVETSNLAGPTESATSGEIEILFDTEPPAKPSKPTGRCYGIVDWFGDDWWAAVVLAWHPNPPYQGVISYAIFEDGNEIATVSHHDALAYFNLDHVYLRFGAEKVAGPNPSHDYSIVAIGADEVRSDESEAITIPWKDWLDFAP